MSENNYTYRQKQRFFGRTASFYRFWLYLYHKTLFYALQAKYSTETKQLKSTNIYITHTPTNKNKSLDN